jgi:APA family basic amino acid/polyamine antiporter
MLTTFGRVTHRVLSGPAAMVGAGLLAGLAPAASAVGVWLLAAIVVAALLAVACGLSTVDSAAPLPYAFGVIGRIAGASAVAETFANYLLPEHPVPAAVVVLGLATAVSFLTTPRLLSVAGSVVVLATLVLVVAACFAIGPAGSPVATPSTGDLAGLPLATLLMFFGFLGFERVSNPRLAIGVVLVVYLSVAGAALYQLGGARLALSSTPLREALAAADASGIDPVLTAGAALACLLVLSGLLSDVREGPRGSLLTPVVAVAAGLGTVLLTVPVALELAAGAMAGHYALRLVRSRSAPARTRSR